MSCTCRKERWSLRRMFILTSEKTSGWSRARLICGSAVAASGSRLAVNGMPQGTPHGWGQAGQDDALVVVRLTPALHSEDFFETFCGLARDEKANPKGLPRNPLQLAVLAQAYRREIVVASGPLRVLIWLTGPLAWIGRRAGFRSQYPEYSAD